MRTLALLLLLTTNDRWEHVREQRLKGRLPIPAQTLAPGAAVDEAVLHIEPSFTKPLVVHVVFARDTAKVRLASRRRSDDSEIGEAVELGPERTRALRAAFDAEALRKASANDPCRSGLDGYEVVLERAVNGRVRGWHRWSPGNGPVLRAVQATLGALEPELRMLQARIFGLDLALSKKLWLESHLDTRATAECPFGAQEHDGATHP